MKRNLLIALLLIPFLGISQAKKPIDGFLGIKFGASKEEVITALKARGGTPEENDDKSSLAFSNIKLGQRESELFLVYFTDNKAYRAVFLFKTEQEAQTIDYYNNLVNDINGIYGEGKSEKTFKDPYSDGDGYETQAISLAKATYLTNWKSDGNLIQIFIDTKLNIALSYNDGKLTDVEEKKTKEKEKSDY